MVKNLNSKGITVIELMIIVSIILILAAVIIPGVKDRISGRPNYEISWSDKVVRTRTYLTHNCGIEFKGEDGIEYMCIQNAKIKRLNK
jgi:hypothetical protein